MLAHRARAKSVPACTMLALGRTAMFRVIGCEPVQERVCAKCRQTCRAGLDLACKIVVLAAGEPRRLGPKQMKRMQQARHRQPSLDGQAMFAGAHHAHDPISRHCRFPFRLFQRGRTGPATVWPHAHFIAAHRNAHACAALAAPRALMVWNLLNSPACRAARTDDLTMH